MAGEFTTRKVLGMNQSALSMLLTSTRPICSTISDSDVKGVGGSVVALLCGEMVPPPPLHA